MDRLLNINATCKRQKRSALLRLRLIASSIFAVAGCQSMDSAPVTAVPVIWNTSLSDQRTVLERDQLPGGRPANPSSSPAASSGQEKPLPSVEATAPTKTPIPAVPKPKDECIIDLAAAFRLAGVDNPTINLAREATQEALTRELAADVLLLPNLTVGGNYHLHQGTLQPSTGFIRTVNSQDLYVGAGARALAAETVAFPGVRLFSHLGDAIYEPLAARQHVESRRAIAFATENDVLLNVARRYLDLLGAEVRLEALRKSEADLAEVARLTAAYANRGQGRVGDAHRADANVDLLRRQAQEAEGDVATASANLAGLLSLDPSVFLRTPGGAIQPVKLIDESEKLETLVQRALLNRPEMRARLQEIAEARTRVRQERIRPFLPTLSVGFSAGTFGGGSNLTAAGIVQPGGGGVKVTSSFGQFDGRTDFDVFAVWTLRNAGIGNRANTLQAEAVVGQAVAELERTRNEVRRQVAEALADAQAASRQIELTRGELTVAEEGAREEMLRTKQGVGRPLEAIDSFRQLLDARQDILRAVIIYNVAQYRLFVAVGYSPLQSVEMGCGEPLPKAPD